jgi:CelD/BcsL family acetyltransferase involved in cellulose biosynthesis
LAITETRSDRHTPGTGGTPLTIDPLQDPRWPEFVGNHPRASTFHSRAWLGALQRTYGYEPIAFTTSPPNQTLENAVVFCVIRSRITGRRLVSLPFSDHCEPLVEDAENLERIIQMVGAFARQHRCRYAEIRPASGTLNSSGLQAAGTYYLHRVNLTPDVDTLLRSFHKDCVQRKIRKAEREALEYKAGRDESLLRQFYWLLGMTRRRHHVPPQPILWFRNLVDCLGEDLLIRIASKDGQPVAGILTLRSKNKLIYKYGGSDVRMNRLGGMPLLFWKSIQDAKREGATEFDLGRTDCDNPGLIGFKEHWAAERIPLTYWRDPAAGRLPHLDNWKTRFAKRLFIRIPDIVLTHAGQLLYRHIG